MSLLQVTGLGKSFGGNRAVDGIRFSVAKGELLALIGPNGAGKSTTFNMVNGQLKPDAGSIRLDGQELIGRQPREIWKLGVGKSVDGLVMVLLGGVQTLTGPVVGAVTFTWLQDSVARATDYWRALLGGIVLLLVLAFPMGIAGFVAQLFDRRRAAA